MNGGRVGCNASLEYWKIKGEGVRWLSDGDGFKSKPHSDVWSSSDLRYATNHSRPFALPLAIRCLDLLGYHQRSMCAHVSCNMVN